MSDDLVSCIKPCPFCGEELEQPFLRNPEVFLHPKGTACFAGKAIVHPESYLSWNTRTTLAELKGETDER